jgi:hypothetical protein
MCPRPTFLSGRIVRWFFPALALAALTTARAGRNDAIVVSATAARDYVRPIDAEGKPVPETYAFLEGEYMGSGTADASQRRMSFDALTRVLAANLIKQNYVPTKDVPAAKLLIRVVWGTTQIYEDPQRQQNIESLNSAVAQYTESYLANGLADPGRVNEITMAQGLEQDTVGAAVERNALLLGYKGAMDKLTQRIIATGDEQDMRLELNEERYFVVLLAYDYELLRQTKKPRLLWITRLSIRSPGNNFGEALPMLALAGAESYGRNVDDLQRVKVRNLSGGEVKMPEMKVLGEEGKGGK